ncbi:MAG: hypothetical protein RLZZ127_3118, partial [Planctomycetota bacterium]
DGDPLSARWDLGDGRTIDGLAPTVIWPQPGTYTVTATIRAHRGEAVAISGKVVVQASGNRPPTVAITAPTVTSETAFIFAGTATATDPDGDPLTITWDFGNGSSTTGVEARQLMSGGRWLVSVTADDGRGGVGYATRMVEVKPFAGRAVGMYFSNGLGKARGPAPATVVGYLPQPFWNDIFDSLKAGKGLLDNRGQTSGIVLANGPGSSERGNDWPSGDSISAEVGLHGSFGSVRNGKSADGKADVMILEQIPYTRYDVLVGRAGIMPKRPGPGVITINGQTRVLNPKQGWQDAYVVSEATEPKQAAEGSNLVIFPGLSGPRLEVGGQFSWLQIVERP